MLNSTTSGMESLHHKSQAAVTAYRNNTIKYLTLL